MLISTLVERLARAGQGITVHHRSGAGPAQLDVEAVFLAVGWPGNADGIDAARIGIEIDRGYIKVDTDLRSSLPHVFAAGDVNGISMLVPSARLEGRVAAENAVLGTKRRFTHELVPTGSFTDPEYGGVGLTESQARARYDCEVAVAAYEDLVRPVIDDHPEGFCKLIVECNRRYVLGAHVVGEYSAEVIQTASACMAANLRIEQIAELQPAFPTFTEGITVAAQTIVRQMGIAPTAPTWGELRSLGESRRVTAGPDAPALPDPTSLTVEERRLQEARAGVPWRAWGPYLSERQWGTVREDYSDSGDAWSYFSHDQARSRAYRWGEDGLAGISDDQQRLCLALALWNERDPILKERLFGLTNTEGNHGEDVKEYYFYVDNIPTHSYQRWLYKYPQAEFPYTELSGVNRARSRYEFEYELVDTGVFDDHRYFDVEVEHAKAGPEDILCRITVHNRSVQDAALHVLPTLWFRNTWSWLPDEPKPRLARLQTPHPVVRAEHHELGVFYFHTEPEAALLFCENETNAARISGSESTTRFAKDGIGEHLLHGAQTINPEGEGTKVAAHVRVEVPAGGSTSVLVRLSRDGPEALPTPFADADELIEQRRAEADEFYGAITPPSLDDDAKAVMRQALAGMLWSKQCYNFDVDRWLRERGAHPLRGSRRRGSRNESWFHMVN